MILRELLGVISPKSFLYISEPSCLCKSAFSGRASGLVNERYNYLLDCEIIVIHAALDSLYVDLKKQKKTDTTG